MRHKVTCPYPGCEWSAKAFLERTADILRETHAATCPNKRKVVDREDRRRRGY